MKRRMLLTAIAVLTVAGCTQHEIETRSEVAVAPVEVKPIHITIDINIRVDRALDNFFSDIDHAAGAIENKKTEEKK